MRSAIVIVDVQFDFLPGLGSALPVMDGHRVIDPILYLAKDASLVVATRDWHPLDHSSFKENGGIWPVHCLAGTLKAEIHPYINRIADVVISKGTSPKTDGYSGFEGWTLNNVLEGVAPHKDFPLYIVGLATDYCVKATALDAISHGFTNVIVPTAAVRGVDPATTEEALATMRDHGISVV